MLVYIGGCWLTNRKFRWLTTFNLVLISVLIALSLVLTNIIGYSRILFGKQVELGNFLIFVIGMIFGPWAGLIAGMVSDLMGTLIYLGGTFHLGFMVTKIGFGLAGALVFSNFLINWWRVKLFLFLSLAVLIQLFLIHPLALYGTLTNDWLTLWTRFLIAIPGKLITLAIEIVTYPFLTFLSFRLLYSLYKHRHQRLPLWANRFQELNFNWPKIILKHGKKNNFKKLTREI